MADSSDDEDFVTYGTALEPVDEDEARRKPVSVKDQVVTDEQGRRCFHGAFTGGFSAGYFNSVGTKEGWTPSSFVSSRAERGQQSRQKAEDFMDDEDLGDFGIAPRKIVTNKDFSNEEQTRKRQTAYVQHHAIPGMPPLPDLVVPNHESIGVQLLKKMGWKHGQGVGPKARRRRNKPVSEVKSYGCAPPPAPGEGSEDDTDLDGFANDFLFAPKDNQDFSFRAKDDYHGIGYQGLDPSQAVLGGGHVNLFGEDNNMFGKSGKQGIRGKAFGVGAFEVEDDDVYSNDHMSRYDKVLGGEEPGDGKYGWTAPKKGQRGSELVVEGFKPSGDVKTANKVFPPPTLPRNFRPFHSFESLSVNDSSPAPSASASFKSDRFTLSAPQRAAMLGEEQLPGPTSVFDMISKDDKTKLKDAHSHVQQQRSSQTAAAPPQPPAGVPTASDAKFQWGSGAGFQPFAKDPEKQRRYEAFVATSKGSKADIPLGSMTEWERRRESEEFTRAANLYRPLSGLMATRFVTAKHEDGDTVEVAEEGGDKTDQSKAAEMKMFGKLTRDTFEWYPDKLLCKRFNIPDPYPESTMVGLPKVKKDTFSVFNFLTISNQPEEPPPPSEILAITSSSNQDVCSSTQDDKSAASKMISKQAKGSSRWDQKIKLLSGAEKMTQGGGTSTTKISTDSDTEERPPMDLFKAIFESDSSSSSSSSEDEDDGGDGKESDARQAGGEAGFQELQESSTRLLQGLEDEANASSKAIETNKGASDTRTREDVSLSSNVIAAGTSSQVDAESSINLSDKLLEGKHKQDKEESEDEYGPSLPPPGESQTLKTDNVKGGERHREHDRTRKYETYLEKYGQSHLRDNHGHGSRTHERTSEQYKSKSRSRSHHDDKYEVRGERSHSHGDEGDKRSKHSKKDSHKEKHSTKEKDRHKHKKEKKSKKKKKKQEHKSRHKERRKGKSSASSDYDASDDTS